MTQVQADETPGAKPQADPYADLNRRLSSLGEGYSAENIVDKIEDMRRGMNEAQRKAAEVKDDAEFGQMIKRQIREKPGFYDHMASFYEGGNQQLEAVANPLAPVLEQQSQQIRQLQAQMGQLNERDQFEQIERQLRGGERLDEATKTTLRQRAASTGYNNLFDHYLAAFGGQMITDAQRKAAEQAAQEEAERNKRGVPDVGAAGGSSQAGFADMQDMSPAEREQAKIDRIGQIIESTR